MPKQTLVKLVAVVAVVVSANAMVLSPVMAGDRVGEPTNDRAPKQESGPIYRDPAPEQPAPAPAPEQPPVYSEPAPEQPPVYYAPPVEAAPVAPITPAPITNPVERIAEPTPKAPIQQPAPIYYAPYIAPVIAEPKVIEEPIREQTNTAEFHDNGKPVITQANTEVPAIPSNWQNMAKATEQHDSCVDLGTQIESTFGGLIELIIEMTQDPIGVILPFTQPTQVPNIRDYGHYQI